MTQDCRTDRRRARVRAKHRNGVDGVEVSDDGRTLTVTFLGRAPRDLGPENIRIDGGRRVRGIVAVSVRLEDEEDPELDDRVRVEVDRPGDSSTYRLSVVRSDGHGFPGTEPYPGFDPRYAGADFDFRRMCPTELDCVPDEPPPPAPGPQQVVNYTARDYASLRGLLLDRLTLTAPRWVERHAPDLGVTVVELLAYVGDRLSYQQDAIATEAYLDTARRRVSVRRHARLVDYAMHDGCNARTFVALEVCREATLRAGDFRFLAVDLSHVDPLRRPELGPVVSEDVVAELPTSATWEFFEPVDPGDLSVLPAHNEIRFWTWGDEECRLPKGATAATLRDEWLHHDSDADSDSDSEARSGGHHPGRRALRLRPGDVLIIEERVGPDSGAPADADPAHRQAVRLVSVTPGVDDLYDQPVVEVTWDVEDALAFSACLSSRGGQDCCPIPDVSVARGNVVLVDHGRSLDACGGPVEVITVPPAPVVPPTCDPPEFGCGGDDAVDPIVAFVQDLVGRTGDRQPLTPEHVHDLVRLLGESTTDRAGLVLDLDGEREVVVPDTAEEQHAALRALLAQITYPAVRPRFRPVLERAPVTQRAPFPLPAHVAAAQARLLATIPGRVRAWLEELWRQARGGRRPSREQVAALTVLFGQRVLTELRLGERPERALRELLARRAELLAAKTRRLEVLRTRALAGGVLDDGIAWELEHTWGEDYAAGLSPGSAALRGPARAALVTDPRTALPSVVLRGDAEWTPRRDLLDSGPRDRHFVGEVEESGRLALRFGDGGHGAAPPPGGRLEVRYRVGNGLAGNVGAEAVNHLVLCRGDQHNAVERVRNPLAAVGGVEPETLDQVRQLAPLALRRELLRAVTAEDYAALAARVPGVQRAAARLRWTGAGREVQVAVDPVGRAEPDAALLDTVARALARVRRIGHQVSVGPAVLVPLEVGVAVCVAEGYQRGHVLAALRAALGGRGFFRPDALTFGEPVRVSALVAAAAAVPGVVTARVTVLRRQFGQDEGALEAGLLRLGPLEVAQLDNDPDHPENGRLDIVLGGGR
ncbi:putative phage baseplate assembly protein [Saccharothrix coeruleofusca]|uniref:putative baseplate assembly protein n=1 Tax=Saccharothrix coeruleofusca TaxID=33919 RepID=UPI001AE12B00|nr:putative baseplate assembly protein [Saccharothrix coeruleofusca]MBP2336544.1 putative phage baseplate assembly protein [Saccharothrix coeruleofusca]